jgi:hypothetical protein
MTEATIAAPAPAAAPTPAPAPAAPPTPSFGGGSVPTSSIDPGKFPIREDYAAALLTEKLAAIPAEPEQVSAVDEQPVASIDETVVVVEPSEPPVEVSPAPAEEDFQLELEPIVTPEVLSQMVTDNPDFGKLLETDSKLKGQLYKTAREAAELKPYREIFPDID